jgi:hypothetical protein
MPAWVLETMCADGVCVCVGGGGTQLPNAITEIKFVLMCYVMCDEVTKYSLGLPFECFRTNPAVARDPGEFWYNLVDSAVMELVQLTSSAALGEDAKAADGASSSSRASSMPRML